MKPKNPEPRAFEDRPPKPAGLEGQEADRQAEALRDKGWVARPEDEAEAHPS